MAQYPPKVYFRFEARVSAQNSNTDCYHVAGDDDDDDDGSTNLTTTVSRKSVTRSLRVATLY